VQLDPTGLLGTNPSSATQINNRGEITGWYSTAPGTRHGYILRDGVVTTIDYPGSTFTQVNGVSDTGVIFGHFVDGAGVFHGYMLKDGSFTQLDYPGALDTLPFYMNSSGELAGEWDTNPAEIGHAFVYTKAGEWITFDAPGAPPNSTLAIGINDHRDALGVYLQPNGTFRSFIVNLRNLTPDGFTFIDELPSPSFPETANNSGTFVGFSFGTGGIVHGLVATPNPGKKQF